jgi:murein DD-endopeptidase MepM/ murein hydrolase activator NlpD
MNNDMSQLIQKLAADLTVSISAIDTHIHATTVRTFKKTSDFTDADFVIATPTHRAAFTIPPQPQAWHFPVGSDEYPIEQWYIATFHDLTGKANNGYKHSGIDYNIETYPRGDIDRGQPVFAVADGQVYGTWYSERNLASVVIQVTHQDAPLYVRYWHLAQDDTFLNLRPGIKVECGQTLGHLGDYKRGGDHLHFDMALDAFHPGCWLIPAVRWVDPVTVLEHHLDPKVVEASLRIK